MRNITKEEAVKFAVKKNVTFLFKYFLEMLDEVSEENIIRNNSLKKRLPEEYRDIIAISDSLPLEKKALLRKKILDRGNDAIRNMDSEITEIFENFRNIKD